MFEALRHLLFERRRVPAQEAPTALRTEEPSRPPLDDAVKRLFTEAQEAIEAGNYEFAVDGLLRAIELKNDFAEAHLLLGHAYIKLGCLEDATDCLTLAAHFRPDLAEAHFYLGLVATQQGRYAEAVNCFERAIATKEDYAEAYNGRGACWVAMGKSDPAVADFRRAVALDPQFAIAHNNLGNVLFRELGAYEEGAQHIETALRLSPENLDVLCTSCMVLSHNGQLDETIRLCDRLLAARPDLEEARLSRGLAFLAKGDFERGWQGYEARKRVRSNFVQRAFPYPEWHGQEIAEKSVLVYGEQGLGDEIMFASCMPDIIARAALCVFDCSPKLEKLFRRSFSGVVVHGAPQTERDTSWLSGVPPIDYQVAIGSLPLRFRKTAADFPRHSGYLKADPARVGHWSRRLDELGPALKVGVSWAGGMPSTRQWRRSMVLSDWLPILRTAGCRFVSLQYGDRKAELTALDREHGMTLRHWQEAIDDYDETAALVSALDLVISVQTSVVHLSGALGKPAWAMIAAVPEWRYLAAGETLPWYPSVRLFRQARMGDWHPVVERISDELGRLVTGRHDPGACRP